MAIDLPEKFSTELEKIENEPSILLELVDGFLNDEQTTAGDWAANSAESNVDYSTLPGSVVLDQDAIPDEQQTTSDSVHVIYSYFWSVFDTSPLVSEAPVRQSFKQINGGRLLLGTVRLYLSSPNGQSATVTVKIQNVSNATISSEISNTVAATTETAYDFDFSADELILENNITYKVHVSATMTPVIGGLEFVRLHYNSAGGYANGSLVIIGGATIGDARFIMDFTGDYYQSSGSIETQNMDVGAVPAADGEWIIFNNVPDDTALTYSAEGSATGAWGGEEVALGAIVDGGTIGAPYYQYYRVTGALSNTNKSLTPEMQSVEASFATSIKISDNDVLEYEPAVKKVSSLTTNIGDFSNSTIGQISITLARTTQIEAYFFSGDIYPRNKPATLKFGFILKDTSVEERMKESEYMTFFSGVIDNYSVSNDDFITVAIRDVANQFDKQIPKSTSSPPPSSIVYTTEHPIDVMLDILKNQIDIRESQIDQATFDTVETALAGWQVTRTITAEQENAKTLLEELRKLMSCYLIPKNNGRVSIKQWNAAEAQADAWTDDDFISIKWDRNSKAMINQQTTYYAWNGTDDDFADFAAVTATLDATSQSDYDEIKEKIVKDKWTPSAKSAQITAYNAAVIARYKDPPGIIDVNVDIKKLKYEVGDIIDITSARPIGAAAGGITNEHFQIINKNLDFSKGSLSFKLLQVTG